MRFEKRRLGILENSYFCISQRDDLHTAPLSRIANLTGQGLDLVIQAEQEATYECLTST